MERLPEVDLCEFSLSILQWGLAWGPGAGQSIGLCKNGSVTKYAVVIHEEPEGGFWAEVPALPGCYSQGDSLAELMDHVREAIAGVLEVLREEGREPESNIRILDVAV
ncbi:MAG: type II toxin-antitoxin system HicB family antitoxin [Bryobacterales bacterium]|nr:type II toxin-antitoxin system HicB family antitoxin [Bryobacterales bacterium]